MFAFAYENANHFVKTYRIASIWEGVFDFISYLIYRGYFLRYKIKIRIEVIHMVQNIRNVRDTSFTFMFSDEVYMAQLYNYITGIKINPTQIRVVSLKDKIAKPRVYNDVAFITDDNHLLVMIDHQSTPNKVILFRMMEYYAALVSEFVIKQEKQNKYGSKELQIPKAEFHIVYNGKGSMDVSPRLDLGDIQVKGSVTDIHFKNLTCRDQNHPLVAYAKLVELITEQGFAMNDAIDQLLKEGYLIEFFGRKEIRDMFVELFSYDQELIEQGRDEERTENIEKTLEIMRELEIGEDIIAQKLQEKYQLSNEEVHEYLSK